MNDFERQRERMVNRQLAERGISDTGVLETMRTVPRERFVPEAHRELSYRDGPLPIEQGQTIPQPYIVALIEQAGFNVVGVEADWPDTSMLDRFVRGWDGQRLVESPFSRFPT